MKVALCASEVFPFAKTGGLADVSGTLPVALEKLGIEVAVFLPKYKNIIQNKELKLTRVNDLVDKARIGKKIDVYFIKNNKFYDRDGFYGDSKGDFPDNLERFQFLSLKTLELLKTLDFKADIIHCHDWHTALIPVYLGVNFEQDPFYKKMKTLLTIHNIAFQGIFPKEKYSILNLPKELLHDEVFEYYDQINLLKAGIIFSDEVSTVSSQYAIEIQTHKFGCGIDGVLRNKKEGVVGILNGLDYDYWNPQNDENLVNNFGKKDLVSGKLKNKKSLQKKMALPINADVPILGMVSRISHQKGFDLIIEVLDEVLKFNVQIIIQGLGDNKYQEALTHLAKKNNQKLAIEFDFNEKLAHLIYAGSDLFLMPSMFEPCGLSQMISMAYGTPPIVYKTGGLSDTVINFDQKNLSGNGFVFQEYDAGVFKRKVLEAVTLFENKNKFTKIMNNAFDSKFLWQESAKKYQETFECLLSV